MPWEPNAYTTNLARRQQRLNRLSELACQNSLVRPDLKCADLQDSMKRAQDFSSSDSELEDSTEVEKESTEENENTCFSKNETLPSMSQARKRRRGIVEKRRRDRINNSLSELRRLVPSALEKQGSTKLEKAEILQMTVDHLKFLHAAGGKGYFEVQSLAMDYRNFGFRECLAEVARYLSMVEGLDASDPLQVHLVSHLSSYASQREVHSGPGHTAWATGFRSPLPAHHHPLPVPKKQTQQSLSPVGLRSSSSPPSTSPAHLPLSSRLSGSGPSLSKTGSSQIPPVGLGMTSLLVWLLNFHCYFHQPSPHFQPSLSVWAPSPCSSPP